MSINNWSTFINNKSNRINNFQTQFISSDSQILNDPSIGHQYICCYEQNGFIILAKALTALASKKKREFKKE